MTLVEQDPGRVTNGPRTQSAKLKLFTRQSVEVVNEGGPRLTPLFLTKP